MRISIRSLPLSLFALAAALLPARSAAQSEGNLTGLVINTATGNALGNAVVSVSGTDRSAVTDLDGDHRVEIVVGAQEEYDEPFNAPEVSGCGIIHIRMAGQAT